MSKHALRYDDGRFRGGAYIFRRNGRNFGFHIYMPGIINIIIKCYSWCEP